MAINTAPITVGISHGGLPALEATVGAAAAPGTPGGGVTSDGGGDTAAAASAPGTA